MRIRSHSAAVTATTAASVTLFLGASPHAPRTGAHPPTAHSPVAQAHTPGACTSGGDEDTGWG
ncbi:hypothetical protein ACFXO2_42575 [Streptomyces sp. NPDC059152]|uniref:hypothetical protein n=1 Tax=unclassified Streptomyces TaxID=2593676 RepID=UPI0036C47F03